MTRPQPQQAAQESRLARDRGRPVPMLRWRGRGRTSDPGAALEGGGGELRLTLPAHADSIAPVRAAVREHGEALAIESALLADICLAVTEACTNVVLHAYPEGRPGPLEVRLWADPPGGARQTLTVLVRDSGRGLPAERRPAAPGGIREVTDEGDAESEALGLGLGLQLMGALSSELNIGTNGDGQTEVKMSFQLPAHPSRGLGAGATMPASKRRQATSRQGRARRMKVRSGAQ